MMKHLVLALACHFVVATAHGGAPLSRNDCGYCAAMEFDRLAALLGDEVLRGLVCRVSFEAYTPRALSSVLEVPVTQVMRRIETLRGWGLARLTPTDWGATVVEPLPGDGGRTLRRWALRYCPQGDACGTPKSNPPSRKDVEMNIDVGLEGGALYSLATGERGDSLRFAEAIRQIDAINQPDPHRLIEAGEEWGRELLYSRRRSVWLDLLAPRGDDLVRIAVRALHIARWEIPRSDFAEGRVGYHLWRNALAKFHAEKTAEILAEIGYGSDDIQRVENLILLKDFKRDRDAQLIEDVASIVFFEYEFELFAPTQSREKLIDIIRKSWRKMSEKGRENVLELELSREGKALLKAALGDESGANY